MTASRLASLLVSAALLGGCSSNWKIRSVQPSWAQQWPYAPNPPKVTYLRAITGLDETAGAGRALANAISGKEPEDVNAFVLPVAVATAADGRIAVADMGRACVHLFVPEQGRYLRLTGSKKERMRTPVGVAFDELNRLYVADSSGAVWAFGADGVLRFVLRSAGATPLERPTGLAYSARANLLYVVDTLAHTVYALDAAGGLAFSFGGRGDGEGRFNFPTHAAFSLSGELLVTDSLNFRVQVLDEKGKFLRAFGHHGDGSGDLAMPKGVAADRDGTVYVADSLFDVVQLFDRRGGFVLTLGRRGTDFGEFWLPAGIFLNERGELYVCDTYNHRIQVFRIAEGYAPSAP